MGISLELVNFDDLFNQKVKTTPVIINDVADSNEKEKNALNKLIYTKYSSDLLSNLPSCECGEVAGEYNVGLVCPVCNTKVTPPIEQELEPIVWMRAPNGVAPLINPIVWTMLNRKFTRSGFEILRWICDTTYKPQVKVPKVMEAVQELEIPRGYNNFYQNFDAIVAKLFGLRAFKQRRDAIDPLFEVIRLQRDCVFSQYLPLPNRSLLVVEETNVGHYTDPTVPGAIDAIRMMAAIDSPLSNHSPRVKENRTIKTIARLSEFYEDWYRYTLAKKEGVFRKNIYGGRSHFSFRAVISSLTEEHDLRELHIPWGIGVSVLRIHLLNKLLRHHNMTPNEAIGFLNAHAQRYSPLLDQLFQELIAECPYPGIPVVFQRNPSLERGSAQSMYVTKVKPATEIPTVSMSILSVRGYNADFDGDQLNGTLSLDLMTSEELQKLAPHMSTFDLNEPRKVSKNLSMPKPVVSTIAAWMHAKFNEGIDPQKQLLMDQIPALN